MSHANVNQATASRVTRIVIAEDEPLMRNYLVETLTILGYQVVASASTGRELVECCRQHHPDMVITDISMPDMDGLEAAEEIYGFEPVPIIIISAFHDPELIARAEKNHILAYLVKPIKEQDLGPAITIARTRFQEFQAMRRETDNLRQALEDRKCIERAKGIIMKKAQIDEAEAFRRLQKIARDKNRKLVEIAHMILSVEEIF
jgi:AmiR/NasT family two-component response regulator